MVCYCGFALQLILPGETVTRTCHLVICSFNVDMPEGTMYTGSVGTSVYPNTTMTPVKSIAEHALRFEEKREAAFAATAQQGTHLQFDIATDVAVMRVS